MKGDALNMWINIGAIIGEILSGMIGFIAHAVLLLIVSAILAMLWAMLKWVYSKLRNPEKHKKKEDRQKG